MPLIILLQLILWEIDSVWWEVDLLGVDLVGVDFMRVDLVGLTCTNIYSKFLQHPSENLFLSPVRYFMHR